MLVLPWDIQALGENTTYNLTIGSFTSGNPILANLPVGDLILDIITLGNTSLGNLTQLKVFPP